MSLVFLNDFNLFKEKVFKYKTKQYIRLQEVCDSYFDMYLPEEHPKGSTTYLGIAIINLSLLYKLSDEKKYYDEAIRFIEAVVGYKEWGFNHLVNVDLSASWIMFSLSLAYDWLKEDFSKEYKQKVLDKLILQSKIMYDYKINTSGKGWSTNYYQNHNWINMCGLACCGYAIIDEYKDAIKYIEVSKENFKRVFNLMSDDGCNYEGVVYWRYGGMWLFIYAHLLKERENIDYFASSDYLKKTFYYRLYQSSSDLECQLNFGDCHDRFSGHTALVYYKYASEYNDPYAQLLGDMVTNNFLYKEAYKSKVKPGIYPEACFELIFYDETITPKKDFTDLPKFRYFNDLGLISIRSGFTLNDRVFSFKCGYPGGKKQWENAYKLKKELNYDILSLSHHHPDNLSFIINKNKAYFATDDGYNRNIMPYNHNVLLVDEQQTEVNDVNDVYVKSINKIIDSDKDFDVLNDYHGEISYFDNINDIYIFKAESYKTYKRSLKMKEVSRTVVTNNLDYIVFIDTLSSEIEHNYQTVLNSDTFPILKDYKFLYKNNLEEMKYNVYSNKDIDYKTFTQTIKSVMTTQEPDKYCLSILKTISFSNTEKTKDMKFYQTFELVSDINIEYHKDFIMITSSKYVDYILLNKHNNFDFDGAVYLNVVDNKIQNLRLLSGSYFKINNKEVLNSKCIKRENFDEVFK